MKMQYSGTTVKSYLVATLLTNLHSIVADRLYGHAVNFGTLVLPHKVQYSPIQLVYMKTILRDHSEISLSGYLVITGPDEFSI